MLITNRSQCWWLLPFAYDLLFLMSIALGANGLVNSPKIITKDGNLIFETGLNRNITFRLSGSSRIKINDEIDLLEMLQRSNRLNGRNGTIQPSPGEEWHMLEDDTVWRTAASDLSALRLRVFGAQGIDKQLGRLQNRTRNVNQMLRRSQVRLQALETKVRTMYDRLELDNCRSSPCENGGTCFTVYNGFICKCTKNFEGPTCEKDVNECALFTGTDLGCQNGGQCVNQHGGYSCICSPGWFGMHCTQRKGDCLQSSAWELCGHGTCVNTNDNFGYKCICDQGWKTNGLTPSCSVDVDECTESHPPCATRCINLPGSFTCAPCAAGLTGNGVSCRDVDECANNNGGCSLRPTVACINTYGSYHCGECPLGFTGDGRACVRQSAEHNGNDHDNANANSNNNGNEQVSNCASTRICHPRAVCSMVSNTVVCTCPMGMVGSGIGPNGCVRGTAVNCNSNPCMNGGTCIDQNNTYTCLCPRGFREPNCTPLRSPCLSNPCLNNGRCLSLGGIEFRCQCAPGFTGRLCDKRFSRCGGVMVGMMGRIKYPEGDVYAHNSQCVWVIRTNETLVLNVTFNAFDLEDSSECRFDWLQINDGRSPASMVIGRFCGMHKPLGGSIISTTNHLYLWFRSDNSTAREGFDLSWNSLPAVCGGLIEFETHGTIKTPGSPGSYPKNRDCIWQLRAPNTNRIKLAFFSMQIEKHDSCNFDYVEIIDAISGAVLEKFCNSTNPAPIMLPTNEADIHFHSDNEGGDTGFQIHYSAEQRVPGCGGTFTAKQDTIRSPDIMQEAISCEYDIKMAAGETISASFTKLELGAEDCVEIYNVLPEKQIRFLEERYCGSFFNAQASPIASMYNGLQIKFHSKGGTFELKYRAECVLKFESNSDIITSPNYPHLNNVDRFCTFKIVTEPNTVISMSLLDFDVNDNSLLDTTDCAYTFLKIYDGLGEKALGSYCGNSTPPANMVSKTNAVILDFQSAITSYGKGFKLEYRAIPTDEGCGGVYTKQGYSIRPPTSDDGTYKHNLTCYWIIMAPAKQGILLLWKSLSLEELNDCAYDYVEIYDNLPNSENDVPLGRYCDSRIPKSFLSHSNILTLKFVSDLTDAMAGFEVTYEFVDYKKICGGDIFSSTGEITTPEWPFDYSNSRDCVWTINTAQGTQMELQIYTFDLEQSPNCDKDYLEIRNGAAANSSLVGKFCGQKIPHLIPSFTNQMRIYFHSNTAVTGRGFNIKWYIFSNSCGGNVNTDLGVITSPLYPAPYPHNAQCDWFVRVSQGSSIHFVIEDLAIEALANCDYDRLEIFDGRTNVDPLLMKLCRLDEDTPSQVVSSGNEALIRFTSDASNTERGFSLSYYANCTRTLTAFNGIIESPNFGEHYHRNDVNCSWTLKAPKGNRIVLEFTHFDARNGGEIYLIERSQNGTLSGNKALRVGARFNSSDDSLVIVQNSSLVTFRLEYSMVGCIEILQRDEGEFFSPKFPNTYPNNVECLWEIRTELGQGIWINIKDMDIEESVNCTRDGLQISSHMDSTNPKERHCGKQENVVLTSSSHRLFLRFYSNGEYNGKGFHGNYRSVKSQCGSVIMSRNGIIQSPQYPQNYPPNADCEWVVQVRNHHTITFTLEELDLEEYHDCQADSVELYEYQGGTVERRLFSKCGQLEADANQWQTSSNVALIRFRTDDSAEAKGFKISFKENCGERIYVDNDETDYLEINQGFARHNEVTNETCIWRLIAKDPRKHIRLSAYHVQLTHAMSLSYSSEDDCRNNGVKIFNGEDDRAPIQAKFCKTHPPEIISTGHALTVQVPLNVISEFAGYYGTRDDLCQNYFYTLSGEFSTPQYPSSYPINIQCLWTIEASAGNAISLTLESLDIEQSDDCNSDYLEIRANNERGHLFGIFCGSSAPPPTLESASFWIKFASNDDTVGRGFLASYSYVMHNELNGTSGTIESPGYPTNFLSMEPYSWRISVDRDFVVLITLTHAVDMIMPFIKFYDGYSEIGAPIDYAEGNIIRSNTNIIYLTATRGPFALEWHQVSKEAIRNNRTAEDMAKLCRSEIVVVDTTLVFNSPGYPEGYATNLNCSWTILPANAATHVVLQFLNIDLEDYGGCMTDYVRVFASNDLHDWRKLDKLCEKPPAATATASYSGRPYLKLDFVTDTSVNKTGFSSYLRTACGSELRDRSALVNITDLTPTLGPFQMECIWTVRVRQGHRIRISFPESYLRNENAGDCRTYFLVRNGIDADSPFLGKGNYCENDISDVLETSSNRAYIKFSRGGFLKFRASFHYEEILHECSDELILSDATYLDSTKTITTPKYPNLPNPHSECVWKVIAPVLHVITLNFFDHFDLAPGANAACDREYVQVNDGGTELMPLLGRFCGASKPNTIYSTSNVLRIKYFTDISEPHMGFKANVSIGRCGGTYFSNEGVISSPQGVMLRGKEREFECVYVIEVAQGNTINLTVDHIDLPEAANCTQVTHLELQEVDMYAGLTGDAENVTDVLHVCGRFANRYIVETNKLVMRYRIIQETPAATSYSFKFSYKSIGSRCGETIQARQGVLQTPGYPGGVSRTTRCLWRIRVPKGKRIKVEFLDFDTGALTNTSGSDLRSHQMRRFFSRISFSNDFQGKSPLATISQNPPAELYSTDNAMRIDALLSFTAHRGFKLRFSSDEESEVCGSPLVLTNGGGSLLFKRNNESAIYCSYDLQMRADATLAVHVEKYETYPGYYADNGCTLAPLKLELHSKDLLPDLLCKNETQPAFRLPFSATMELSGNIFNKLRELMLQYQVYDCGGILPIADNMTITQPSMDSRLRGGRVECAWAVWPNDYLDRTDMFDASMDAAQLVVDLTTDFKHNCEEQYLIVYNGPDQNSPHLGLYCQKSSAVNLVVEHGLFFEYVTNNYELQSTFNLNVKLGSGCGGRVVYPYRTITFADEYQNNVECVWDIVTDPGFHVGVSFIDRFFIESSPQCTKDFLKVQQREPLTGEWKDLQVLCGRDPPKAINTTSTEMRLIFHSDSENIGDGFTARFERNCGGLFYATDETRQLSSPGYPEKYSNNLFCNYTILPSESDNRGLLVRFLSFDLEQSPTISCLFDNVTIYANDEYNQETETNLCGSHPPREFRSKEKISIVLRTDSSTQREGFLIEYSNALCGGLVTNATIIQSPRQYHDSNFPASSNCYWNLTAPTGSKIMIKFEELDFEVQKLCMYDGVEIYQGLVPVSDQRLGKLCGNLTGHLPTISIPSNTGLIHSFSDEHDPSRGFRAVVSFSPNCDQKVFLDASNDTYLFRQYASGYTNNLDCSYVFSTVTGRQLQVEFNSFHVEEADGCANDYLDVHDGAGPFADRIGSFCGHLIPAILMSSKNAILMRFVTNSVVTSAGFEARIKSIPLACGSRNLKLNSTQTLELKSPDDGSGRYLANLNCIWSIKADSIVHLKFEKFDLQEPNANGTCESDFLKFYGADDAEYIEKGLGSNVILNGAAETDSLANFAQQHVYCGNFLPDDYFATSNEILMKFKTDSRVEKSGFKIIASAASGCFRNFTGTQGRIQLSATTDHCDIYIRAPQNYSLSLYYSDTTFFESDCDKEYLEVFETKTNTSLQKNCQYIAPGRSLFTKYNELRMHIRLDGIYTQFDITYLASPNGPGCGGNLFNTVGVITSPYYPDYVRESSDCRWNIRVPNNVHVLLHFEIFDLGAKTTCHSDYLQIIERTADDSETVVRQFCGEDQPQFYKSNNSFLSVRFHKTVNYDGTGWMIKFNGVPSNYKIPDYYF